MTVDEAREVVSKPAFFRDRYVLEALCVLVMSLDGPSAVQALFRRGEEHDVGS